jgi:type I restriction enzyme S subunit
MSVPADVRTTALAHLLLRPVQDGPHETPEWVDDGVPFLSVDGIIDNRLSFAECRYISPEAQLEYSRKSKPQQGDVLLTKAASIGKVAIVETKIDFNVWSPLAILRPDPARLDSRFLYFALQTTQSQDQLQTSSTKNTQQNVAMSDIGSLRIPSPPVSAQRAIAEYLDRETAHIDALIAVKRRMVELLQERWQGYLETEIRGVAEEYGQTPLKYVCREVVVGIVITPSAWYADAGVPAIRGTNVSPGAISTEDLVYLTQEGHRLHPKSQLRSGDVVVVRTGQAGAAAVVPPELDGINCIDLVIIRLRRDYSPHFLEFVMNSDWMQKHVDEHSVGTIQSHFNVGSAAAVLVPRAPITEQDAIVDRLRRERRRVTGLVNAIKRQLELLEQHRQALITAAVTGQLDIPGAA